MAAQRKYPDELRERAMRMWRGRRCRRVNTGEVTRPAAVTARPGPSCAGQLLPSRAFRASR